MEKLADVKERESPSEPSFHIRRLKADDAYGIFDIFQRTIEQGTSGRGEPYSLDEIRGFVRAVASASSASQRVLSCFVAETDIDTSRPSNHSGFWKRMITGSPSQHSLIGCVIVFPFRSTVGAVQNPCYSRTGAITTNPMVGSYLDREYVSKVHAALVSQVLATCREEGSPYKTLIAELSFKEDQPHTQQNVYMYQDQGFQMVGKLEAVLERNGVLIDRVFMQKHL